ncbi:hypothetical protein T484DRAFT_1815315 [Baffinella frigidus]|nr:hypothetical protein T484DRAFT_1815315 [Cryptophyta sp. CCMP2293]
MCKVYEDVVSTLLARYGADVNATDAEGNFPLNLAMLNHRDELLQGLIERGAHVDEKIEVTPSP